ncbi:MAG: hypothetical protein GTO30_16790, partial [Acidobacteria bacterium]|nr:hypothetical protein [Acidobacteriota bacterium]
MASGLLVLLLAGPGAAETRPPGDGVNQPKADSGSGSATEARRNDRRLPSGLPGAPAEGSRAPLPRAVNFPQDVPVTEIRPAATLAPDPARDNRSFVAGKADGRVIVIHQEDRTAKSQSSSNSGVTFSAETTLPTGPSTLEVDRVAVDFDLDNGSDTVYVLLTIA